MTETSPDKAIPPTIGFEFKGKSIFNRKCEGKFTNDPPQFYGDLANKSQYMTVDKIKEFRENCNNGFGEFLMKFKKYLDYQTVDKVTINCTEIPDSSDNTALDIYIHKSKNISTKNKATALLYFHGGGLTWLSAQVCSPLVAKILSTVNNADESHKDIQNEVIIFNVDYRKAPETNGPNNIHDCYAALKWMHLNKDKYNIDANKVVITGDAAGGFLTVALANMLSERGESNLVKLALPIEPHTANFWWTSNEFTPHEANQKEGMKGFIEAYTGFKIEEKHYKDKIVFPNEMGDEIASKWPNTVIMTCEYAFIRRDAEQLADIMQKNNKLLDFVVYPGCSHAYWCDYDQPGSKWLFEDIKAVFENYVFK